MTNSWDPEVYQFDLSNDPLTWMQKTSDVNRYLLMTLGQRKPAHGESYYEFTRAFYSLLNAYIGAGIDSERFVGGITISANYKGDTGEKAVYTPVDATTQKRALRLITSTPVRTERV